MNLLFAKGKKPVQLQLMSLLELGEGALIQLEMMIQLMNSREAEE